MKDKKYCIIGMDNIKGLNDDIIRISTEPHYSLIGGKETAIVATFKSDFTLEIINEIINVGGGRSFFVFEVNDDSCIVHIDEPMSQKLLFPEMGVVKKNEVDNLTYDEKYLTSLDKDSRSKMIDELLEDVKNLTNNEKKILNFLASL